MNWPHPSFDTLPKYDMEIWEGIQGTLVVFGEGPGFEFILRSSRVHARPLVTNTIVTLTHL